jgi:hypothetical protein
MSCDRVSRCEIAHHEAGHAVIARVLSVDRIRDACHAYRPSWSGVDTCGGLLVKLE